MSYYMTSSSTAPSPAIPQILLPMEKRKIVGKGGLVVIALGLGAEGREFPHNTIVPPFGDPHTPIHLYQDTRQRRQGIR